MFDLEFLGYGSGIAPELGNNSAMLRDKNGDIILFDCGGTTFTTVHALPSWKQHAGITILITHTHGDHISGLASLIMSSWFERHIKPRIVCANNKEWKLIQTILNAQGVPMHAYSMETADRRGRWNEFADPLLTLVYTPTVHVEEIPSYSIELYRPEGMILYTGDTKSLNHVIDLMKSSAKVL
jgi:ribonuclease BN (tRNA processing enzyme)